MDSSVVQLSSTHVAVETMAFVKRWDRKQRKYITVSCPAIVKEYNIHMGGVSVVNGWLLYRRHSSQRLVPAKEQLNLIEFTAVVNH